jgi:four helix bundle protein
MGKSFHDLVAFQRAMDVVVVVYEVTSRFPSAERFGLVSQLRRAAVGVVSQIAEGQGRLTYGEWRQFLSQARGSLYEVEAQLLAAERLHFIRLDELEASIRVIKPAGKALAGLIRWVMAQQPSNRATQAQQPSNRATQKPT